jgi:hypothetical protein
VSTLTIDQEVQRQRQEYIEAAMAEFQLYDMMYLPPHMPAYVDYMPVLREIGGAVVKWWKGLFSTSAGQAGRLQKQEINC